MGERHADIATKQTGTAMKRRGILAAAGAAVAGIVAMQAAQPVAAATFTLDSDNPSSANTYIHGPGADVPWQGDIATPVLSANNTGVNGNMTGIAGASSIWGVYGLSVGAYGAGVYGSALGANGSGVVGECLSPFGSGVTGRSYTYYGVYGQTSTGVGVLGDVKAPGSGTSNIGVLGRVGVLGASAQNNTVAVYGQNQCTGTGEIGVNGTCTHGIGASFTGGIAPLRLVPGALSARTLTNAGHQAGELYMTSDNRLFLFDGANWRELLLAAPGAGVPPAAAARPSTASTTTQPVQPIPQPRSG